MINLKEALEMYKLDIENAKKDLKIDAEINLNIDEVYKKFVSIKEKLDKVLESKQEVSFRKIEPGIVCEMETDSIPQTVVVLEEKENTVVIAQMSYMYELATVYDFIVKMAHPLRDFWIVETDLIIELEKNVFVSKFHPVSNLNQSDIEILVSHYKKGEELPLNRIGKGTSLPEKIEFKKIELKRYKQLFGLIIEEVEEMETDIVREVDSETEIQTTLSEILSDKVRKLAKPLKDIIGQIFQENGVSLQPAADSMIKPFVGEKAEFIYEEENNELSIIFPDNLVGKPVEIVLSVKQSEFPLFFLKKAPGMITVKIPEEEFKYLSQVKGFLKVKVR